MAILGNGLTDGQVSEEAPPSPVVTCSVPDEVEEKGHQQVFPACAVTRAQTVVGNNKVVTKEMKTAPNVQFPLPSFPFSLSCADLIQEQQVDPALLEQLQQVRPVEETESAAHGYFLEEGMLVMKWFLQGDKFVGDAIFQIVVPTKLRDGILRTAHNMVAVHLGLKKTYDRIFRYFYWRKLKRDNSVFIKTCHTCQLMGKP